MAYAYVRSTSGTANTATITSITSPTLGNQMVLVVNNSGGSGNGTLTGVTDNSTGGTGTWHQAAAGTNVSNGHTNIWYNLSVGSGMTTITMSFNGGSTPGNVNAVVHEYNGLSTFLPTAPAVNTQTTPGTGANAITSNAQSAVTFVGPGAMVFGWSVSSSGGSLTGAGTGFTSRFSSSQYGMAEDGRATTSGSSQTATFTDTSHGATNNYSSYLVCFAEPSPVVLVQSAGAQSFSVGVSSLAATFSKAVTAGNTILAHVGTSGSPTTTFTVSDSVNSGNYVVDVTNAGAGNCAAGIYRFSASSAGTPTVTASVVGGATLSMGLVIEEWFGLANSSPLDQSISNFNTGASTSPTSANTGNYFETGELMVSVGCSGGSVTWTPGTGFTSDANSPGGHQLVEYQLLGVTTGSAATYSLSAQAFWQVLAAVYKPASPNLGALTSGVQVGTPGATASYGVTAQTLSSSTIGTITSNVAPTLGAIAGTFVEGSLLNQINLTGQTATFAEGVLTPFVTGNVTLALSGMAGTIVQGALLDNVGYVLDNTIQGINLVGQTATFVQGTPTFAVVPPLTAQTITSLFQPMAYTPTYTMSAQTITSLEGFLTSNLGGNVTQQLGPQTLASLQQPMSFVPNYTFSAQTGTFAEGSMTFSATGDFQLTLGSTTAAFTPGTILRTQTFGGGGIPNVVGLLLPQALALLQSGGETGQVAVEVNTEYDVPQTVIEQYPAPGTIVPTGTVVLLVVSLGPLFLPNSAGDITANPPNVVFGDNTPP